MREFYHDLLMNEHMLWNIEHVIYEASERTLWWSIDELYTCYGIFVLRITFKCKFIHGLTVYLIQLLFRCVLPVLPVQISLYLRTPSMAYVAFNHPRHV